MPYRTQLNNILHFFLLKIFIGLLVVGGTVAIVEWAGRYLLALLPLTDQLTNLVIAIIESILATTAYIYLFRIYERREISELHSLTFSKYAMMGFATGLILQTSFIIVIYLAGGFTIVRSNSFSALLPAFTTALSAGFVAEILIRGVFFRILEEKFGTIITITIITILFGVIHSKGSAANPLSVLATAVQAGFLLSAAYVLTRNLWFTIFIHFAWDFAEPGIFGAINPGNNISESLFTTTISGPVYLTGGSAGPQNSLPALVISAAFGALFLWLAFRNGNFLKPGWKN